MAADIVPELIEAITSEFRDRLNRSRELVDILKRIPAGGTLEDIHELAELRGRLLSETLQDIITPQTLPNGRMYWNIATRTVTPFMVENYDAINEAAKQVQSYIDREAGIGLNPMQAPFPRERVRGLSEKLSDETVPVESALRYLGEPIINTTESFADDFVEINARFRYRLGMDVKVVRSLGASERRSYRVGRRTRDYRVPCEWCQALAGTYDYTDTKGSDVWKRHESCRCVLSFYANKSDAARLTRERWS